MRFFKLPRAATDEELMLRLQKGDQQALAKLYKKYSPPLLRYFYRMLWQDEALAQDCLQDLFEKIIYKKALFKPEQSFKTWIYAIAYNSCKNHYRSRARQPAFESAEEQELSIMPSLPEDEQTQQLLQQGLKQLSEEHQTCFLLRYEQEIAIKDIAIIMDCSEGTVKSRLFYAKKKLAKELAQLNPYD